MDRALACISRLLVQRLLLLLPPSPPNPPHTNKTVARGTRRGAGYWPMRGRILGHSERPCLAQACVGSVIVCLPSACSAEPGTPSAPGQHPRGHHAVSALSARCQRVVSALSARCQHVFTGGRNALQFAQCLQGHGLRNDGSGAIAAVRWRDGAPGSSHQSNPD